MIGFGWETWRSTLPEDEGERMGCGKRKTMDRKRALEPGGVYMGEAWWLRLLPPALQSGLALIHLS